MMSENINRKHYDQQYKTEIELKYKTNTRWLLSLINRLLRDVDCNGVKGVLDVGCGSGIITAELARRFATARVNGVDLSEVGIKQAKEKYGHIKNLSFFCDDAMILREGGSLNLNYSRNNSINC